MNRKSRIDNSDIFITECGLGASGIPHIGSFADASRAYAVKVAAEDIGTYDTAFYAYSDDLDGLRKVPAGMPERLRDWIGVPVSLIPDPEECHYSYGQHMVSLLLDSLDEAGIQYTHQSAAKLYAEGRFADQIDRVLERSDKVGRIIEEETGQEKYLDTYTYHPICHECRRIYTTKVIETSVANRRVDYSCEGAVIGGKFFEGCSHTGHADYNAAEGKLSWKVEFAARWSALQVDFEPYGKDILESVMANNRISQEILGYNPPHQIRYEMFLDRGGTKISKSKGNVFTPQMWFENGSPQSLVLMTLRRIEGARSLSTSDIGGYMDELNDLEALYHGFKAERNSTTETQLRALYELSWWYDVPEEHSVAVDDKGRYSQIPYSLISHLGRFCPDGVDTNEFVRMQLEDYGLIRSTDDWRRVQRWVHYPINWSRTQEDESQELKLSQEECDAIRDLSVKLSKLDPLDFTSANIQHHIFQTSKEHGIKARNFFPLLYRIYLGTDHGPKIGNVIDLMGQDNAIGKLRQVLASQV